MFGRITRVSKLPYLTKPEERIFNSKLASGELTIFRVRKCRHCRQRDVPKSKEFCSKECYENAESGKKPKARA